MIKIDVKPMANLSKENQKYICTCDELCKNYIHLDDYGRVCEKGAEQFAHRILYVVKKVEYPNIVRGKGYQWKVSEEQILIDWYNKGDIKYGDVKILSKTLKRSYSSVRNKIDQLRKEGRIWRQS